MMFRRKFIQSAVASVAPAAARGSKTVTYKVEGFTCVTCAVGLDTMLRDLKGVGRSKSSYPDRMATIEFDADVVTEAQIKAFVHELGFAVTPR
jgi:copper chaperone